MGLLLTKLGRSCQTRSACDGNADTFCNKPLCVISCLILRMASSGLTWLLPKPVSLRHLVCLNYKQ